MSWRRHRRSMPRLDGAAQLSARQPVILGESPGVEVDRADHEPPARLLLPGQRVRLDGAAATGSTRGRAVKRRLTSAAPTATRKITVIFVIGSPCSERYLSGPEAETVTMTG